MKGCQLLPPWTTMKTMAKMTTMIMMTTMTTIIINFRFKPSIATMTTYRDSNFVTAAFSGKYTLAFRQI